MSISRTSNGNDLPPPTRDNVFVAGGQPTYTYVDRAHLDVEGDMRRAFKVPNQIVSLSGPSKSGKTVLCRRVLNKMPHIWLEGGQHKTTDSIWDKVCYILNYPREISKSSKGEAKGSISIGVHDLFAIDGSLLKGTEATRKYAIDTMESAIRHLKEQKIALVIDDFHYVPTATRTEFLRNIKGPVFDGLKLVLLSVSHRGLDAVKAETELQGRVYTVAMKEWETVDLRKIGSQGFTPLNVVCPDRILDRLTLECQSSPFLMQKLCWEVCAGLDVDQCPKATVKVPDEYDFTPICKTLSKDFGHPIYLKLELGPPSRKSRRKRFLKTGGSADIYRAILIALAATGPKASISYDELRDNLSNMLAEEPPQKNEVTSALKHLKSISQAMGNDAGVDWESSERRISITDPYLRFYLRWQIRPIAELEGAGKKVGNRVFKWGNTEIVVRSYVEHVKPKKS